MTTPPKAKQKQKPWERPRSVLTSQRISSFVDEQRRRSKSAEVEGNGVAMQHVKPPSLQEVRDGWETPTKLTSRGPKGAKISPAAKDRSLHLDRPTQLSQLRAVTGKRERLEHAAKSASVPNETSPVLKQVR